MKWMKVVLPIAVLGAGVVGMKVIQATAGEDIIKQEVDTRPTVTIEHLSPEQHTVKLTSYGEVAPLETTNLAAQVAGEVVQWNPDFVTGGIIKRGETLFTIESDAYEAALLQAQSAVYSAKSKLIQEQAQADVAKREAENMAQSRVTDLYLRKPQLLSAQAELKSAEAQLKIAQRDLDNCKVKAPYDALVVSRNIGVGDYVSPGTMTAELNNIETAEITFPIAGFDRSFLAQNIIGGPAMVSLDSSGVEREAIIHRDLGRVDKATRMAYFVARIDDPYSLNSDKPVAKFGSYVNLAFEGRTLENVYKVPQELVTNRKLWTLDDDNKLVPNTVKVIREEGGYFLIQGDFNSDKVVMSLPEYPQSGMEVKIIEDTSALVAQRPAAQ